MGLWLSRAWARWGEWLLATLFVAAHFTLMTLKQASFHTFAFDLGKLDQAMWNALHGRFLYATLGGQSVLGDHFSPILALVTPLYWIWNDVHVYFLVQAVGLAVAGLFLHKIVAVKHPRMANWFLLAFFLNPALHEVALYEAHRVVLAVPFLAWALYALYMRQRKRMVVALFLAMLCKENIGYLAFMVGAYLSLFERDWKWGIPVALGGASWLVVVSLWVVPAFAKHQAGAATLYPQLGIFCVEGSSYQEILANVLREPQVLIGRIFDGEALLALLRVSLPVGLALPFLAADWLLIIIPSLLYMLASCVGSMHRLENWYMAEVLPGLFAAMAVGLTRLSTRHARWALGGLLVATAVGYALFSHAPLGGMYEAALYQVTGHDRLAAQVVAAVPAKASVAAQDAYVPHLAHREQIYMYPWLPEKPEEVEYFVLDRQSSPYPAQPQEMNALIDELVSLPQFVVELEGAGIYLLHQGGTLLPGFSVGANYGGIGRLERVDVADLGNDGFFQLQAQQPIRVRPGQTLRVSFYWAALPELKVERTVSLRLADSSGAPLATSGHVPTNLLSATGSWPVGDGQGGWQLRDVHYLSVPAELQAGQGWLEVVLYDGATGAITPSDAGANVVHLVEAELAP